MILLRRVRDRLRRFSLLLALLLAGGGFFDPSLQAQEPGNENNRVHGIVINSATHLPLGRALVSSADDRFATFTDSEGNFEFSWPVGDPGLQSPLQAKKPGFLDDAARGAQVEISASGEYVISLMPEALIIGRVVLSSGGAAAGVNVQIYLRQVRDGIRRWEMRMGARTNSNGEFRFAELAPGSYKVATSETMDNDPIVSVVGGQRYGYPPVFYPSAADFAAGSAIQLAAGQTYQADISVVRQPYYPVQITVSGADPGGGMNVTVSPQSHRGPGYSLGYNAEKQRIEGLLPNGSYEVEARAFGRRSIRGVASDESNMVLRRAGNLSTGAVNLAVAGIPATASMVLNPSSSINIEVREEFTTTAPGGVNYWSDGQHTYPLQGPRSYLQVSAEAADDFERNAGGSVSPPHGANDRSLILEDIAPGRYWLRLNTSRGYVAAATMGGVDLLRQPMVIGTAAATPVEITMRDDMAEIEGSVSGIGKGAAAGADLSDGLASFGQASASNLLAFSQPPGFVYCIPMPDSPGAYQELGISANGKFNSQNIAPGSYRVMAFKHRQPELPYRDTEAMRAYESAGQVVHLSAGQKSTVQVQMVPNE